MTTFQTTGQQPWTPRDGGGYRDANGRAFGLNYDPHRRFHARRVADAPVGRASLAGYLVLDAAEHVGQVSCNTPDEARRIAATWNAEYPPLLDERTLTLPGEPL